MTQSVEQLTRNYLTTLAAALTHPETTESVRLEMCSGVEYIGRLLGVEPSYFETWPAGYEMKPRIEVYRDLFESAADIMASEEFLSACQEYEGDFGEEGCAWEAIAAWVLNAIDILAPNDGHARESAWVRGVASEYYKQSQIHGLAY